MPRRAEVLVAQQPAYLPSTVYFSRLLDAGRFVALDHVPFAERGRKHRTYLRDPAGRSVRLTVPVRHDSGQRLHAVRVADDRWRARHWRSLGLAYSNTPYWPLYAERFRAVYDRPWELLADLNVATLDLLLDALALDVAVERSSQLRPAGQGNDRLLDLCQLTGTSVLRVGAGTRRHLDPDQLRAAGVTVEVATYTDPGPVFGSPPPVSVVDLLFRHGPGARELLETRSSLGPWPPPPGPAVAS